MKKLMMQPVPPNCKNMLCKNMFDMKHWRMITAVAKSNANGKCAICGKEIKNHFYDEIWKYHEIKNTMELENVIAVCSSCHKVIHALDDIEAKIPKSVVNHFTKVNNCKEKDFNRVYKDTIDDFNRRSLVKAWKINIMFLKDILEPEEEW